MSATTLSRASFWQICLTLAVAGFAGCSNSPTGNVTAAPSLGETTISGESISPGNVLKISDDGVIAGRYIVTLHAGADAQQVAADYQVETAGSSFTRGFTGRMSETMRKRLAADGRISSIEPDRAVEVSGKQIKAPWGLDRLDQLHRPLSSSFSYNATGKGVTAYVIDSGIMMRHISFDKRASSGYDGIQDGRNGTDCSGHGTHVAGIIGGWTTGVAKEINLVSVRVFDCKNAGTLSGVIAGVEWVIRNHKSPAVANLSFNAPPSAALDDAVRRLSESGVVVVVSAGNAGKDACTTSPARVSEVLTVGASDEQDNAPAWSNYGPCVDLTSPGVNILSTWYSADNALAYGSGTSMAAPFAAGVAALYLEKNRGATQADVTAALKANAYKDVVAGSNQRYDLLSSAVIR